ncbi:MipA/OmpV family protein [Sphingomonas sp. XXL09]|uniref:MipA/OmpV family protein n=1 Tax=Sphingomonas sp. XXL09 TaxID=3457787 RepID=UPI00406BB348
MSRLLIAPAALLALLSTPAFAQDTQLPPADTGAVTQPAADIDLDRDTVTAGVVAVYLPDYEGSNHYRWTGAPAAIGSVKGFAFTLAGNRVSVDLIPNPPGPKWDIQAGPIALVNFNRTTLSQIDDPRIRALGKLDTAIELGGYVGIGKTGVITSPYDKLSVSVSYRHDVSGVHDAGIWQPTVNYFTPLSLKAAVGLFASAERAERGYAQTYFGITPAQSVASGFTTYSPRGGWKNWGVGALGTYSLTGNLLHGVKLVAGGTYRRMLNDFGNSPVTRIAGSKNQWLGAVGLAYTF